MIARRSAVPLSLVLVAVSGAAQTVYRWTDARGVEHFSDDRVKAPGNAKVQHFEDPAPARVSAPAVDGGAPPRADRAPVRPRGPGEAAWRGRFQSARRTLEALAAEIAAEQRVVENPALLTVDEDCEPYVDGRQWPYAFPKDSPPPHFLPAELQDCSGPLEVAYEGTRARLAESRRALDAAQTDLEDLERDAANAAVPLEWRR
jgi:hypothetical protein